MPEEIINRVANSGLISFDLETLYVQGERLSYDMKEDLFQGLILKEKEFRASIKEKDWSAYENKYVNIHCSVDVIIPTWAYMLLISKISPVASEVVIGSSEDLENYLFQKALDELDPVSYKDARLVIKGCSKFPVPSFAYGELVKRLLPFASSIMYGEPCSTVPVYKKPKDKK